MKYRLIALGIVIVVLLAGFFVYASEADDDSRFPFKLGLDLAGGVLLTYRADTSETPADEIDNAMATLRDVIERRINIFGVTEPVVLVEKSSAVSGVREHRLIVELPGVTDVEEATRQLGQTPLLEFKLLTGDPSTLEDIPLEDITLEQINTLYTPTGLTGRFLDRAQLQFGDGSGTGLSNEPTVLLEFNSEGRELFADITREHVGEVLAIFLDGFPITQPVIQSEIPDGQAVISGTFSPEEARNLVRNLNFGALPLPIELISEQTIGATLGEDALSGGIQAGLWGLLAVALFLVLWYRLPGLLAVVSLGMYVIVMLALFKLIPVTLTAAGIAGFILSVGMAVDANVLIFERMKEELRGGRALRDAIAEGFSRAWLSIRDSNLSSIITAIILFWFGTSLVKGFALVFGVGVLVSMVTAVTVTRTFLLALSSKEGRGGVLFGSGIGGGPSSDVVPGEL